MQRPNPEAPESVEKTGRKGRDGKMALGAQKRSESELICRETEQPRRYGSATGQLVMSSSARDPAASLREPLIV